MRKYIYFVPRRPRYLAWMVLQGFAHLAEGVIMILSLGLLVPSIVIKVAELRCWREIRELKQRLINRT